jgi:hypothetical protein
MAIPASASRLKAMALEEALHVQSFVQLLMKPRNGAQWTPSDKAALTAYLKHLARILPIFSIFTLPGGSLLLPLLAMFLDRRRHKNRSQFEQESEETVNSRQVPVGRTAK